MKNQVKKFSQYIRESRSDSFRLSPPDNLPERISLMGLMICWVQTKANRGTVLIAADISNPARDLVDGGISLIRNPSQEDIDNAISLDFEWGLFEDGELVDSNYKNR